MPAIPSEFTLVYINSDELIATRFQKVLSDYIDTRQRNALEEPNPQVQLVPLEPEFCMALLDGQGDPGNSQKWNSVMVFFNPGENVHLADIARAVSHVRHEKTIYVEEVNGEFVYVDDAQHKNIIYRGPGLEHLAQTIVRGLM